MRKPKSLLPTIVFSTLMLAGGAFVGGCDSGGESPASGETGSVEAAAQVAASGDLAAERAAHAEHHAARHAKRAKHRIDELCSVVECTDAQREQFEAAAKHHRGEFAERHKNITAARKELADAFRGDAFAGGDVERFASAMEAGRPDRAGHRLEKAEQLHGILTPEQRTQFADAIESGELKMGGKHGRRGKHGKHAGKGDPEKRAERMAKRGEKMLDRLCERLACTEEQRASLGQLMAEGRAAHHAMRTEFEKAGPEAHEQMRTLMAETMRAETFDASAIMARKEEKRAQHQARRQQMQGQMAELAVAVHGILTPVQRAELAEMIAEGHMPPFFGGGKQGKHGRRGRHHRGH